MDNTLARGGQVTHSVRIIETMDLTLKQFAMQNAQRNLRIVKHTNYDYPGKCLLETLKGKRCVIDVFLSLGLLLSKFTLQKGL